MLFESELNLLPKVVLGVRNVFKYAGGISPEFAAAFSFESWLVLENLRGKS